MKIGADHIIPEREGDVARRLWYVGTLLLTLLFGWIYFNTPLMVDDLWFLNGTQGMKPGWERFVSGLPTLEERLGTDAIRFGNIFGYVFLTLFPKWVFNILAMGMIWGCFIVYARLAGVRKGSLSSWILVAGMIICLPWYDYFFTLLFSMNYLPALLLGGMTMDLLVRGELPGGWRFALWVIVAFGAGWAHEGFGMPIVAGATAVGFLLWRRGMLNVRFVVIVAAVFLGSSIVFLSPSLWNRVTLEWKPATYPLKELIMQMGPMALMTMITLIAALPLLCKRKYRNRITESAIDRRRWLFSGVFCIASLIIDLKYFNGPRTACGLIMVEMVLILMAAREYGIRIRQSRLSEALEIILFLLLTLHLTCAGLKQRCIRQEHEDVIRLFMESADGTIYYDLSNPLPDLSLFKTTVRELHERIPLEELNGYLDKTKTLAILPEALEGLGHDNPSGGEGPGVYAYEGHLLAKPGAVPESPRIEVLTESGEWIATRYRKNPFRDLQGREWVLITPHIQVLDPTIRLKDLRQP